MINTLAPVVSESADRLDLHQQKFEAIFQELHSIESSVLQISDVTDASVREANHQLAIANLQSSVQSLAESLERHQRDLQAFDHTRSTELKRTILEVEAYRTLAESRHERLEILLVDLAQKNQALTDRIATLESDPKTDSTPDESPNSDPDSDPDSDSSPDPRPDSRFEFESRVLNLLTKMDSDMKNLQEQPEMNKAFDNRKT